MWIIAGWERVVDRLRTFDRLLERPDHGDNDRAHRDHGDDDRDEHRDDGDGDRDNHRDHADRHRHTSDRPGDDYEPGRARERRRAALGRAAAGDV